ncbi:MAG: hypothetical protein AAGI11_06315 [Pseudomonadota bacterium]
MKQLITAVLLALSFPVQAQILYFSGQMDRPSGFSGRWDAFQPPSGFGAWIDAEYDVATETFNRLRLRVGGVPTALQFDTSFFSLMHCFQALDKDSSFYSSGINVWGCSGADWSTTSLVEDGGVAYLEVKLDGWRPPGQISRNLLAANAFSVFTLIGTLSCPGCSIFSAPLSDLSGGNTAFTFSGTGYVIDSFTPKLLRILKGQETPATE